MMNMQCNIILNCVESAHPDLIYLWAGSYSFIQQHIRDTDPRTILRDLLPETVLPPDLDDMTLWQIIINISEPPKRKKRKDINTLEDVVRLLHESKRILVLTGAGVCKCYTVHLKSEYLVFEKVQCTSIYLSQSECLCFFYCRCQFHVGYQTSAPEMVFMHVLL